MNIMKRMISLILLLSFLFNACTHFMPKYHDETLPEFYYRINKKAADKTVILKMTDNKIYNGKEFQINTDSSGFYDLDSNLVRKVATDEICSIAFNEPGRSIWEGFGSGISIGALAGLLPNLFLTKVVSHPKGNPMLVLYGALAGAAIGFLYGANNAGQTIVELRNN